MHLLPGRGCFLGGLDFLKEGVNTHLMAPMSPLNSPNFLAAHHL
jgi:hypothetical protein